MIRKATYQDIDSILRITRDCAKHMINQNIYQWNEFYPSRNVFENDIKRGELYVFCFNSKVAGCIVISNLMDEEYKPVKWLTKSKNNIYIHRLAVDPIAQGKGFAQQLMSYAESYAIENNYTSIRLDTFSKNNRNQKFYELRGYNRLENIFFPKQSKYPFYCYELIL